MNAKGGPAVAYNEQLVASITSDIPLTTDKTVIEANALMATALASQIKLAGDLIRIYDERIESLFDTLPDAELFTNHSLEWDRVWTYGCLPHWVITTTASTAPKKFKTTLASHQ